MTHTKTGMFKSWQGVKIRQLSDNTVFIPEEDEMAIVSVHFVDKQERPRDFPLALNGREIDHVEVTTSDKRKRYIEAPEYVEDCEVLD